MFIVRQTQRLEQLTFMLCVLRRKQKLCILGEFRGTCFASLDKAQRLWNDVQAAVFLQILITYLEKEHIQTSQYLEHLQNVSV
jgi:hypothetical protein